MYTTTMPVTLMLAAALALLNVWLSVRVGQVRRAERVSVGDGGNERVTRRMRAHANFAEYAPLTLGLVFAVELAAGVSPWLWGLAALFVVGRLLHPFGMDGWMKGRIAGTALTLTVQILLALWAISIVATGAYSPVVRDVDPVTARG